MTLCGDRRATAGGFLRFCGVRAIFCGDRRGQNWIFFAGIVRALAVAPCEFVLVLGKPSAEIVRVEALLLWRRAVLLIAKWPFEVVVCAPALAIPRSRVRFPPGPRQLQLATFKDESSRRSTLSQLRLENRNF